MCWMSVDLPEPVCPAMPKNSPGAMAKLTSRSAHTASGSLPQSGCGPSAPSRLPARLRLPLAGL